MEKLIFVYNADSGLVNGLIDWAHKIISPATYPCSLCAITYDNLGMRSPWKKFIMGLRYDIDFLHRDELENQYQIKDVSLPAVFFQKDGALDLWIKSSEMDTWQSLDELQSLITKRLAQNTGQAYVPQYKTSALIQ